MLPADPPFIDMLSDYALLRNQTRACRGGADGEQSPPISR